MSEASRDGRIDVMRSKLFVPADQPALFPKALASAADAICFDLEDSVLPAQKAKGRRHLQEFLASEFHTRKVILVRVNHVGSDEFAEDLSAAASPGVAMLALPKVEDPSEITDAVTRLAAHEKKHNLKNTIGILATIESARGLRLAASIGAADARVVGLQLGLADMFEPLGIRQDDGVAAHQVRLQFRLVAGERGIPCFDSAFAKFKDEEGFMREAAAARGLGFAGKSCIHPCQIEAANRIFSPSSEEIAAAVRCMEAARAASMEFAGAFALEGRMIDGPFVRRAKSILDLAEKIRVLEAGRVESRHWPYPRINCHPETEIFCGFPPLAGHVDGRCNQEAAQKRARPQSGSGYFGSSPKWQNKYRNAPNASEPAARQTDRGFHPDSPRCCSKRACNL